MTSKRNSIDQSLRNGLLCASLCVVMTWAGCAADPRGAKSVTKSTTSKTGASNEFILAAQQEIGTKFTFHFSDYYTLTAPRSDTSCAGDMLSYYSTKDGKRFPDDPIDYRSSVKPSFIKNVSVDLTDANATLPANYAYSCSLGNSPSVPPTSNCATFDYGAMGGVPTTLGGTFLIYGGQTGYNYAGSTTGCGPTLPTQQIGTSDGFNSCNAYTYALTIDGLPSTTATSPPNSLAPGLTSASQSISNWVKLSDGSGTTSPAASAAGSAAYSAQLRKILLYGGVTSLQSGSTIYTPAADSNQTWTYDLATQKWAKLDTVPYANNELVVQNDTNGATTLQLSKDSGARANFGYTAVPRVSLDSTTTNGVVTAGIMDSTERIVIIGGLQSSSVTSSTSTTSDFTLKLNPTFGPEKRDILKVDAGMPAAMDNNLVHWVDSYHTQSVNNLLAGSLHQPTAVGQATKAYNFGAAPVSYLTGGLQIGTFVTAGGFDPSRTAPDYTAAAAAARLNWATRNGGDANIASTSNFSFTTNSPGGTRRTPVAWDYATKVVAGQGSTFEFGGSSLLPGFDDNHLAYFGGATCQDYLDPTATNCNFASTTGFYVSSFTVPTIANMTSSPQRAGMATARGRDASGNIILVAWGGVSAAGTANDGNVYVLYDADAGAGFTPTWRTVVVTGSQPSPFANASLVYSHVTGKYYLFGGYQTAGTVKTMGDTWELSISGDCTSNGATTPTCTFAWRQLNTPSGLTCHPTCPESRRSHRMVEVNYNNTDPTVEPDDSVTGCSKTAPCSFGIFMEGGTTDGLKILSDRWMFDPTANGGYGHWQRVGGFPPRNLASLTTAEFRTAGSQQLISRGILYGGQTGMHNSRLATSSTAFIAPTLADTYMYDFANNTWNRAKLLGSGYYDDGNDGIDLSASTQLIIRQSYRLDSTGDFYVSTGGTGTDFNTEVSPDIAEMTPPPLAGATVVSRVYPTGLRNYTNNGSSTIEALKIPQVFLFGGRKKDGTFNLLNQMYKFCPGSTGEKPPNIGTSDDATCDAFDPDDNTLSQSPVQDYAGRWLRKTPVDTTGTLLASDFAVTATTEFDPAQYGSYMGAGTYDPLQDKVLLFGGISPTTAGATTDKITDSSKFTGYDSVFEYTAPTKVAGFGTDSGHERNGYWDRIPPCSYSGSTTPEPRYGHSMGFDPVTGQIIVVGGFAVGSSSYATGTPLGTTYYYAYGSYTGPEVWTAKKITTTGYAESGGPNITSVPCYYWKKKTTFGNDPGKAGSEAPNTTLAHAAGVYIPAAGYNTGYYTMLDYACGQAGPVVSNDPTTNKLLAGGAYIDLNREALGKDENLLLNITYLPLSSENLKPDASPMNGEVPIFRIHLIHTNQPVEKLRSILQPRYLTYSSTDEFPQVARTLSVLAPPYANGVRQEQVIIPLASDPGIDRIRIERYSGSAILIDATIFRTGKK